MDNKLTVSCKHITVRVSDIIQAKDFYIEKLGLTLLDENPAFFAAQAGHIRFSFFGGYKITEEASENYAGVQIIFSVADIEEAKTKLLEKGLTLTKDITNANNYLKFILLKDPDGIVISIAQYLIPDTLEIKI